MNSKPQSLPVSFLMAALGFLAAVFPTFSQTKAPSNTLQKTFVVAVGVARYPQLPGGQQLQFADRDAQVFVEALKKTGIAQENIKLLIGQEATVANIKSAIGNWVARAAGENDTVYFYFSGQGIYESGFNEAYLLAYDSNASNPYATAISVADLRNAFVQRVRSHQVMLIADAVRRDFFDPDTGGDLLASAFTESFGKLAASRPGLTTLLASGPKEFSREGQRWGGYGVFTKFLVDALSGGADRNADGTITNDEVFNFLSSRMASDTANKQHPWRSDPHLAEMAFVGVPPLTRQSLASTTQPLPPQSSPTTVAKPNLSAPPQPTTNANQKSASKSLEPAPTSPSQSTAQANHQPPAAAPSQPAVAKPPMSTSPSVEVKSAPPVVPSTSTGVNKKTEATTQPKAESVTPAKSAAPKPKPTSPPSTTKISANPQPTSTPTSEESSGVTPTALPPPPTPPITPPSTTNVSAKSTPASTTPTPATMPVINVGTAPSPLILQLQAAIQSGNLLEPRGTSAWEVYQRLAQEQSGSAEVARLKPVLAEALMNAGLSLVGHDVRSDNVNDKVDEFRRAGQFFTRARTLKPEDSSLASFEKISAAQALLALQFYDEAERALTPLQTLRSAIVENALGLVYQGKLDDWRAERAFKRAIELDGKYAAPHYNLALLYRTQKSEAAIEELARASALDSQNLAILTTLGDEYFARQQWQLAGDTFRKAIAIKEDSTLRTKLANTLYSQGLRDEANREYQKANELRKRGQ